MKHYLLLNVNILLPIFFLLNDKSSEWVVPVEMKHKMAKIAIVSLVEFAIVQKLYGLCEYAWLELSSWIYSLFLFSSYYERVNPFMQWDCKKSTIFYTDSMGY